MAQIAHCTLRIAHWGWWRGNGRQSPSTQQVPSRRPLTDQLLLVPFSLCPPTRATAPAQPAQQTYEPPHPHCKTNSPEYAPRQHQAPSPVPAITSQCQPVPVKHQPACAAVSPAGLSSGPPCTNQSFYHPIQLSIINGNSTSWIRSCWCDFKSVIAFHPPCSLFVLRLRLSLILLPPSRLG